jgi:hypothetical protein
MDFLCFQSVHGCDFRGSYLATVNMEETLLPFKFTMQLVKLVFKFLYPNFLLASSDYP